MATITYIYEARILIRSEKPVRWHSWKDGAEYKKDTITRHIERRTLSQAMKEAKKYAEKNNGEVLSCRKVNREVIAGNIEALPIQNPLYVNKSPYDNAIAMDEMIWKKRRRKERLNNGTKDKKYVDL